MNLTLLIMTVLALANGKTTSINRIKNLDSRSPTLCTTIEGKKCIFPFKYEGAEYYACTFADSPTAAWCATGIYTNGTVIPELWGDCNLGGLSRCSTESDSTNNIAAVEEQAVEINDVPNVIDLASSTTTSPSTTTSSSTTTPFPALPSSIAPSAGARGCVTISGPAVGNPCVFPFTYSGKTYNTCTQWIFGGEDEGKLWCSTKTDVLGHHINGEGQYGFCPDYCGPNNTPLTGANARDTNFGDAVIFRDELPGIVDYPK